MAAGEGETEATYPLADRVGEPLADAVMNAAAALEGADYVAAIQLPARGAGEVMITASRYRAGGGDEPPEFTVTVRLP